jgi:hypothetical protein
MNTDLIKKHTITDWEQIRIALSMPNSLPKSWAFKPLVPIGMSKFKGDKLPGSWSVNGYFTKGKEYPIYSSENGVFAIGSDGKGYKFLQIAWTKIK